MKPKDVFGIVVRTIGVILVLFSFVYFYGALAASFSPRLGQGAPPIYHIGFGVILLMVGAYCLRGAPKIVDLAYPEERTDEINTDENRSA
jgi:hypothetical protein